MKIFFIFLSIVLFIIYILSTKEEKKAKLRYAPKGKVEEYWSAKERRRVERYEMMLDVKYKLLKSPKLKLTTSSKNISEDGICILAHEILPKDSITELEIILPNAKEPIHAKGVVAWCEDIGQVGTDGKRAFLTGISFINIVNEDKARLINYISTHLAAKGDK